MKRYLIFSLVIAGLFMLPGISNAQSAKPSEKASSVESVAQKRTVRMKDELFLSNEQFSQVLDINREMLLRLNKINSQNLGRSEYNKQISQLNNWAKNKIVPLLTPTQRERFESALFAKIYETRIDKNRAYTQKR